MAKRRIFTEDQIIEHNKRVAELRGKNIGAVHTGTFPPCGAISIKARKKKAVEPTEHQIQSAFFDWARNSEAVKLYPDLRWIHAIPNGGARHVVAAVKFKREGVLKGIPDVGLPCAGYYDGNKYCGIWMEFKRKGGKQTPEQVEFFDFARSHNQLCLIFYDTESAIRAVSEYLHR
jgi:hypothetical protein